jgi:adenylate kinase family enzyme
VKQKTITPRTVKQAKIIDQYYQELGIPLELVSRRQEHLQPRVALMKALTKHMTQRLVGEIFNTDRTNVYHHVKNHHENMKSWKGYKDHYALALNIVNQHLKQVT